MSDFITNHEPFPVIQTAPLVDYINRGSFPKAIYETIEAEGQVDPTLQGGERLRDPHNQARILLQIRNSHGDNYTTPEGRQAHTGYDHIGIYMGSYDWLFTLERFPHYPDYWQTSYYLTPNPLGPNIDGITARIISSGPQRVEPNPRIHLTPSGPIYEVPTSMHVLAGIDKLLGVKIELGTEIVSAEFVIIEGEPDPRITMDYITFIQRLESMGRGTFEQLPE